MDLPKQVTLELIGLPSQRQEAELIGIDAGAGQAIVKGYAGRKERYSLKTGRRIGSKWKFWKLVDGDILRLRKLRDERRPAVK